MRSAVRPQKRMQPVAEWEPCVTHRRRPDQKLNEMEEPECSGQDLGTGSRSRLTRQQVAGWQVENGSYCLCLPSSWYQCWLPSPQTGRQCRLGRIDASCFP